MLRQVWKDHTNDDLSQSKWVLQSIFPSTIMQEEEQAETGDIFNLAEENFFSHRLKTLYPKVDEEGIKMAISFLATQKLVNCPCSVHTEERGYECIVFRRQPDRKIGSTDEDGDNSITESISDDDIFLSAEAEDALLDQRSDNTEPTPECEGNLEKENSSTEVSDGYKEKAKPQMSNQLHDSSLHSREDRGETSTSTHQSDQKKKKTKKEKKKIKTISTCESPMIINDDGQAEETEIPKKRKGFSY